MLQLLKINLILMILFACDRGEISTKPPIHLNPNMDRQEKYKPQEANYFFEDKSTMLLPPEGTIAQGKLKNDKHLFFGKDDKGKYVSKLPNLNKLNFASKKDLLKRGRERYNIYCSVCHGYKGDGKGTIAKAYQPAPADLRISRRLKGELYSIIATGYPAGNFPIKTMSAYNIQLDVTDRWAVVAYLQILKNVYENYKEK